MVLSYLNVTDIQDNLERGGFEIKQASAFIFSSVCTWSSLLYSFFSFLFFLYNFIFSDSLSLLLYSPIKKDKGGNVRTKEKDIRQSQRRPKYKPQRQQEKGGDRRRELIFGEWGKLICETQFLLKLK